MRDREQGRELPIRTWGGMSARLDDKDNRIPVRAVITVTEPSKLSSEPLTNLEFSNGFSHFASYLQQSPVGAQE
jgi:hypothetical protein